MEQIIVKILKRIRNIFRLQCPDCKEGNLHVTDVYISRHHIEINVYECDKCGKRFM